MQTVSQVKQLMQQAVLQLEDDLSTLRPGRASADLVGTLPIPAYGGNSPLSQVASISASENGQLIVEPWDKSLTAPIETAIRDSQLGFSVINEGTRLRLSLPPLSQERRLEFVKIVQQKGEATRIRLRQIRGDAHQEATKAKTGGEMREDELNRFTKELNTMIDDYNQQVKTATERKEKELIST